MAGTVPTSLPTLPPGVDIHVIPEEFYGSAVKAPLPVEKKEVPPPPPPQTPIRPVVPPPSRKRWPVIVAVLGVIVVAVGGFVYFNRNLLFPPPPVKVADAPKPPPLPPLPAAPTSVSASSTTPRSVTVSWVDANADETGFQIERREGSGTFVLLTNLPSNSASFLDVTASPSTTYAYRVRTINVAGQSEPSQETVAVTPPEPVMPQVAKLPPAGLDSDSDGLTDVEEVLYGTDVHVPDTDGDGFLDGNEVFHLYNPAGRAPVKLLDSSLLKVVNASVGWILSIPESWTLTKDAVDGSKATIDSHHGETFVVAVEDNPTKLPVLDWYLARHPGITAPQVLQYRSKGGYTGIIGADMLTTYVPWGDKIFSFTYKLGAQNFINYRTTYSMMLNSLMLSGLPQMTTPPAGSLPFEPSATDGGVVTQPVPVTATSSVPEAVSASSTSSTTP